MAKPGDKIFRLDPKFASRWDDALAQTGLSQQEFIARSVIFILEQEDDVTRAMMLKQVQPADDLVALLLKRMANSASTPRKP